VLYASHTRDIFHTEINEVHAVLASESDIPPDIIELLHYDLAEFNDILRLLSRITMYLLFAIVINIVSVAALGFSKSVKEYMYAARHYY
jgi:hypothetical protein